MNATARVLGLARPTVLDLIRRRRIPAEYRGDLESAVWLIPVRAVELCDSSQQRELALEAARRSLVLLKNKGGLPFRKGIKKIAVIGPNARETRTGGYSSFGQKYVSPLEGIGRSRKVII